MIDRGVLPWVPKGDPYVEDEQPSIWAQSGGKLSRTPRNYSSLSARRRAIFDADVEPDDDLRGRGVSLRTRTIPTAIMGSDERQVAACGSCRHERRRCSLKKPPTGPCTYCSKEGLECKLELSDIEEDIFPSHTVTGADEENPIMISSRREGTPGVVTTIQTNWTHPVDYKFNPLADRSKSCHFCEDFRYAIFGCGLINVSVIIPANSVSYEEMGDGHRAEGKEPTRICLFCAFKRLVVCKCPRHEMVDIGGLRETSFNFQDAYTELTASDSMARHQPPSNPWCSLCVSPAFYACGARQTCTKLGVPTVPGDQQRYGCGLLLCGACADAVRSHGMNRTKLREDMEKRKRKVRADIEFLFLGSHLHQAYSR